MIEYNIHLDTLQIVKSRAENIKYFNWNILSLYKVTLLKKYMYSLPIGLFFKMF